MAFKDDLIQCSAKPSRWWSYSQIRCVSRNPFDGTPLCEVTFRRWHPGYWLYVWRMRRVHWIQGEALGVES